MLDFHRTRMGGQFFYEQIPEFIEAFKRIADALEKQNELKEKFLERQDAELQRTSSADRVFEMPSDNIDPTASGD